MALTKVGKEGITGISNSSDATAITIDSSENVGIGTASPSYQATIFGSSTSTVEIESGSDTGESRIYFTDPSTTGVGEIGYYHNGNSMRFNVNNAERMRINEYGNLLIGRTNTTNNTGGHYITSDYAFFENDGTSLYLNRIGSDGFITAFRKDDSNVGYIGSAGGGTEIYLAAHSGAGIYMANSNRIIGMSNGGLADNYVDVGHPSYRFDDIYATNGTIQTSDQNEKQQIASLTTAEITAAKAISALFKTFKWNDKVEAKGDDARTHTGVIAQEVQTAMTNAGLDAADYAFWCSNTWTDDDGNSQTRMGIRYPELLAFVGAATEQRLADIETRLTALETE